MKAFRIPIAPIPAGSGNATAINLLGLTVRLGATEFLNFLLDRVTDVLIRTAVTSLRPR